MRVERVLKEREGTSWGRDGGLSKCKQEEERELVERESITGRFRESFESSPERKRERAEGLCCEGEGRGGAKAVGERERV